MDGQLAAWQTQTLRLTAFPSPAAQIIEPSWWRDLRREEPETRIFQPRKGGLTEEGPFAEGKLTLKLEPTRIDWLYTPIASEKESSKGFQTVGPLLDAIGVFSPLMNRWFELDTCPNVQRLAFGAVLLQPAPDRQTAYQRIMQYVPSVQIDVENSSDFSYQINRRRNSKIIPRLNINRLTRWSAQAQQHISIPLLPTPMQHSLGPLYYACRLELDINTVSDFQDEFGPSQLSSIFQELISFAVEISNQGDVP